MARLPAFDRLTAAIFDMDGVLVETSRAHAASWKEALDPYLARRAGQREEVFVPMKEKDDYLEHLDGRTRYEGARAFLDSRGEELPFGDPCDEPGLQTICGLANLKDVLFLDQVRAEGVKVFGSSILLVRRLYERSVRLAVVTGSLHADELLEAAGVASLFEVKVGGGEARDLGLPGKPHPATFLEAARRLDVDPSDAAVIEDSLSGVEAARRGGFGLVLGVDRVGRAADLLRAGAHAVVTDLAELVEGELDAVSPFVGHGESGVLLGP